MEDRDQPGSLDPRSTEKIGEQTNRTPQFSTMLIWWGQGDEGEEHTGSWTLKHLLLRGPDSWE